jgi:hypothetical protein
VAVHNCSYTCLHPTDTIRSLLTDPNLLRWVVSVATPAVFGFLGVVAGAWLTARRERAHRRYLFREKQLQDFYSPLLGLRAEIRERSEQRKKIQAVADSEWQRLCAGARQRSDPEELLRLQRNRWSEFEAVIDYDDRQLAQELVPAYRKMLSIFRDNLWLAEPETLSYFAELLKFVDMWDRWLTKSIPAEVVQRIGHSEGYLQPFYQHLESKHEELRDHLSKGVF